MRDFDARSYAAELEERLSELTLPETQLSPLRKADFLLVLTVTLLLPQLALLSGWFLWA